MPPLRSSKSRRGRQQPYSGGNAIVSPAPAPTGATQPSMPSLVLTFTLLSTEVTVQDRGSPSDNGRIHDATAVETTLPGISPRLGHADIPVPVPTQGLLTGTGNLNPAPTDVQLMGPHRPEGSVDIDVSMPAYVEGVPLASSSSRPAYRLDPAKAQEHVDRIRRFRILVMGRANAGKTTILQRVCNTTDQPEIFNGKGERVDATVVQGSLKRGYHNIEDELVFRSNPRFVFHDSCGFEAGSEEEFNRMKEFVMDRAKATKLDKRIHAIWFCIPLNDSHRMVMAAEKKFFDNCDTGHVPVILLATKADTLELEAFEQLEDEGLSLDDAGVAKLQMEILIGQIAKLKDWLGNTRFPPHDYLSLTGMQQHGADCTPLLACTTNALREEGLQQLLISTQQSNLELCMTFAIMKTLNHSMKGQRGNVSCAAVAYHLSRWFPYRVCGIQNTAG
ncbi:hypothetical protein EV401DRAFT_2198061 [Pisolithus croceorrhizus]|nr:hypothetical protein EV401DRAFT_2198061 [Pisolithus croceorrhizus]